MKKFIKNLLLGLVVIVTIVGQPVYAADNDFKRDIYNHLENWDTEFDISYYDSDVLELVKEISEKDDYLARSISRLVYERVGRKATIKVTYKTTKEQEEYINTELVKIVKSIISPNMSDFDKVKAVNKYIIDRYEYDNSLKSNNVYSALTTGKTICQGYAMTAYKMLNLAGIENRIIIGELDGVPHGWNLVKLNEKWYHLDTTNNDATGKNIYFLKNDETLKNDGFVWKDNIYPVCDENYDENSNRYVLANGDQDTVKNSSNSQKTLSESNNGQTTVGYKSSVDGNWSFSNSSWYFLKSSGGYATGWNIIDNKWYWLGSSGAMQTGWINYDGKWYYCYPVSGVMAVNTIIDGQKIDSTGAWIV